LKIYAWGSKVFRERVFSLFALCVFISPADFIPTTLTLLMYLSGMTKATRTFTDQMGATISVPFPPRRIVSLVPSQTELLADLGLKNEVVGITKYCVHPDSWQSSKALVGGTKNFRSDVIDQLCPDLIIGNKEENFKEGIELLQEKHPVWMSDINTLSDALQMIEMVGQITNREERASFICSEIRQRFNGLKKGPSTSVLYLIWRKPWMAAGKLTFIDAMLEHIGAHNILTASRYPVLEPEAIGKLKPETIFLSSEPYPFEEKHIEELQVLSPASKIILVDGEMFSWYGTRLLQAPAYFESLRI
jgi:ABC-type Fe3+-hydroxamate transport system substrate-binding protein